MRKILYSIGACAMLLLTGNGVVHAAAGDMINVDVQGSTYDGSGPILTNGYDYYPYSLASASGESNKRYYLIHADGSDDSIRLTYTTDASTAIRSVSGGSSSLSGTSYAALFDGYMTATSTRTISFTGLDPNANYEMVVYSQGETGRTTTLQINGTTVLTNTNSTATTLQSGVNYALISTGLSSDSNGALSFTYLGQISGFQLKELSAAPEPASMVLLGVGGVLAAAAKLRRKPGDVSDAVS